MGALLFSLTSVLEKEFLLSIGKCSAREHYLSSTFLSMVIFLLALSFKTVKRNYISSMGERDSLYIYIFHPVLIYCLPIVFTGLNFDKTYLLVAPLLVILVTLLLIRLLRFVHVIKE